MALKDGDYPWGVGATPNQQLAHILAAYFNDDRYIYAAYPSLHPPTDNTKTTETQGCGKV